MWISEFPGSGSGPRFDEDLVFAAMAKTPCRNFVICLAINGPQSNAQLMEIVSDKPWKLDEKKKLAATLKALQPLIDASIVKHEEYFRDKKRSVTTLSREVIVTKTDDEVTIDLGCVAFTVQPGDGPFF